MQVIKLYFKLLKNALPTIIFYLIIFIVLVALNINGANRLDSSKKRVKVAVVNYNASNELTTHLIKYLEQYLEIHDFSDKEDELEEGIFYGKIDVTLMIPYQFGEDYLKSSDPMIGIKSVADKSIELFISNLINHYYRFSDDILINNPNITAKELIKIYDAKLSAIEAKVITNKATIWDSLTYFKYAAYVIFVCILYGVNLIMRTFKDSNIKKRILLSLNDETRLEKQLFLGNFIFTNILILVFIVIERIINNRLHFNNKMIYIYLHFMLYSYSILGFSYLLSILVRKKEKQDIITHLLPLTIAFLSGIFIAQEELRDIMKQIASFTPTFWFIKGNQELSMMNRMNVRAFAEVFVYLITCICFNGVFFALSLVIMKYKNQRDYNV